MSLKRTPPSSRAYPGRRSVNMHARVASRESHENCCALRQNTCSNRGTAYSPSYTVSCILFLHNGFHDNIRIESLQYVHHLSLPGRLTIV